MLHIKDWDVLYENASSRNFDKLQYVLIPNRLDSSGYTELVSGENGPQRYAAWIALLIAASRGGNGKYGQRGYLLKANGQPHNLISLALLTRIPATVFQDAIPVLLDLGWLEREQ